MQKGDVVYWGRKFEDKYLQNLEKGIYVGGTSVLWADQKKPYSMSDRFCNCHTNPVDAFLSVMEIQSIR